MPKTWHPKCRDSEGATRTSGRDGARGYPTVLVIEDNDDVRDMMAVTLEMEGHEVMATANGRDALELLRGGAVPCVILLDLMMPVMNGWEFNAALNADPKFKDLPVVVISAAGAEIPPLSRVAAYMSKPIDIDMLLDVVDDLCLGKRTETERTEPLSAPVVWRRE
ncbi:MAG TPA: response regulator [Vicinamibacterales bacterium]|nr:response regulator [Vicinamibacterales bacterium]